MSLYFINMAYRDCYLSNVFKPPADIAFPIGTILDLTGSIINPVTNTGVALPLLGAGYTLPAGVWSVDAGCLAQITGAPGESTQYVNSNFTINYNGVILATTDWGYLIAGDGTADLTFSVFKQHFVSGAVASTGGAELFNVVLTTDTAGGETYDLDTDPSLADQNFIRVVRIA
jgi:hypothetical protein